MHICTSFIYLQNKIRKSIPSKRPGRFINVDQAIITKLQSVLRSSERRVSRLLIGQLSSIQHSHWLILSTQGPTIPCPAQMLWPIHRHILTWPNATTETHDNHSWYNFNTWRSNSYAQRRDIFRADNGKFTGKPRTFIGPLYHCLQSCGTGIPPDKLMSFF